MQKLFIIFALSCALAMPLIVKSAISAEPLTDTVLVSPLNPTTDDTVTLTVKAVNHCCCTQHSDKKVTLTDAGLNLFDAFDDRHCQTCGCFAAGSNIVFTAGPLKPGKYKIYWSEDMYCPPGEICPAVDFNKKSNLIGEVLVKPSPATDIESLFDTKKTGSKKTVRNVLSYSGAEKKLTLRIAKAQNVWVTAYIVNGEKSKELSSKKYLSAGVHSFRMDLDRLKSGVVIIHVKGEDFSEVQMINLAK